MYENIKFGLQMEDMKIEFGISNVIILAKYFIHKCRFLKIILIFSTYLNDIILYKNM